MSLSLKLETNHARRFYCEDMADIVPLLAQVYMPSIHDSMMELTEDERTVYDNGDVMIVEGVLL